MCYMETEIVLHAGKGPVDDAYSAQSDQSQRLSIIYIVALCPLEKGKLHTTATFPRDYRCPPSSVDQPTFPQSACQPRAIICPSVSLSEASHHMLPMSLPLLVDNAINAVRGNVLSWSTPSLRRRRQALRLWISLRSCWK